MSEASYQQYIVNHMLHIFWHVFHILYIFGHFLSHILDIRRFSFTCYIYYIWTFSNTHVRKGIDFSDILYIYIFIYIYMYIFIYIYIYIYIINSVRINSVRINRVRINRVRINRSEFVLKR